MNLETIFVSSFNTKMSNDIDEIFANTTVFDLNLLSNVDAVLEKLDNVITGGAIILDKCVSRINLNAKIIEEMNADYPYINFSSVFF